MAFERRGWGARSGCCGTAAARTSWAPPSTACAGTRARRGTRRAGARRGIPTAARRTLRGGSGRSSSWGVVASRATSRRRCSRGPRDRRGRAGRPAGPPSPRCCRVATRDKDQFIDAARQRQPAGPRSVVRSERRVIGLIPRQPHACLLELRILGLHQLLQLLILLRLIHLVIHLVRQTAASGVSNADSEE